MNDIGISSSFSAYTQAANSVYRSNQVSPIESKQEVSDAKNLSPNLSPAGEIEDVAIISDEAKALLAQEEDAKSKDVQTDAEADAKSNVNPAAEELSPEQKQEISKLKARDMEVKAHEQAHIAAASGISASAPSYDYQVGPDGKRYAIGGEVNISFTEGGGPESNISKAEAMKAAALAPAQPSSQDLSVARNADRMIASYKEEASKEKAEVAEPVKEDKPEKTSEKPVEGVETTDPQTGVSTDNVSSVPSQTPTTGSANQQSPLDSSNLLGNQQINQSPAMQDLTKFLY